MAPKLHPGERVLYDGHPSWRSILDFYIKGILATVAIALIAGFVTGLGDGGADSGLVTVIALVGIALTLLAGFVKRVATNYTITDRRLHIKRGIVSRTIQETRLERVQNVNYNQSVIQRMLQIGDVDFDTAAGDDYNFVFVGVADPAEVVERVDRATHSTSPTGLGDQPTATQSQGPQV
jgi:uncharacterized membrane protein YdbT with pleckstrin-like domain